MKNFPRSLVLFLVACTVSQEPGTTSDTADTAPATLPLEPRLGPDDAQLSPLLGDPSWAMLPGDHDEDGFSPPADCDDEHVAINPSQPEICDGVDNNCDGSIDEGGVCAGCDTTALAGYAFCTTSSGWSLARATCEGMGYHLVALQSASEDTAVVAAADSVLANQSWWMGLNDLGTEGDFQWTSGETVTYTNWNTGEPNNLGDEDCAQLAWSSNDSWNDNSCNTSLPFVCETCVTTAWYVDGDGDGYGDPLTEVYACVKPAGTVADGTDCDDTDHVIHPGAAETCDGADNDCDGDVDEGMATWFRDADGDGYGDPDDSVLTGSCPSSGPPGYVPDERDCDDLVPATNPLGTEICDGADNDCDNQTDEAPGSCSGACIADTIDGTAYLFCDTPDDWYDARDACRSYGGYTLVAMNDGAENSAVSAYADAIDGGTWWLGYNDLDSEGTFTWSSGDTSTYSNWNSGEPNNSGDEDCAVGNVGSLYRWNDLGCTSNRRYICEACTPDPWFADDDGDGYGDANDAVYSCVAVAGRTLDNTDCDDTQRSVSPGGQESCNGIDDDCDGLVDEEARWHRDRDGDSYGDPDDTTTTADCSAAPSGYVGDQNDCDDTVATTNPLGTEICNGFDDDCDASIDEGGVCSGTGCTGLDEGDTAYLFCDTAVPWATADAACASVGYDFVAIDDASENDLVTSFARGLNNTVWWSGLNDRDVEGTFVWANGDPVTYTNWNSGEPNNSGGNEDCAELNATSTYQWNDRNCSSSLRYVCETCGSRAWFADDDGDGYGDPLDAVYACEAPSGYVTDRNDCDDTDPNQYPGAPEACNSEDDDCDGSIDEDAVVFRDADTDTYGDPDDTLAHDCVSATPPGYVLIPGDCEDGDIGINPAAIETCDAVDEDCDGLIDDGNPCTNCTTAYDDEDTYQFCNFTQNWFGARIYCQNRGYDLVSIDDATDNAFVAATAGAISNGNWWIGLTDHNNFSSENNFVWVDGTPFVYDDWSGGEPNNSGNEDCTELRNPANNPNWNDEGCGGGRRFICEAGCDTQTYYVDSDGDGFGDPFSPVDACRQTAGLVVDATDCDDTDDEINPLATDDPGTGIDEDCDGVDDCYADPDGDGYGDGTVLPGNDLDCTDSGETDTIGDCAEGDGSINPGASEITADGIDQDCDLVDDCWLDGDGDGVGVASVVTGDDLDCDNTVGESSRTGDCDDSDTFNAPGNVESPANGLDEDCSGADEWFVASDFATGDLIITELVTNPSSTDAGWFEVYNAFGTEVSLSGMQVDNGLGDSLVIDTLVIPRFEYAVFAQAGAVVPADVVLPPGFALAGADLTLSFDDGVAPPVELDNVDVTVLPPPGFDESISLDGPFFDALDNDVPGAWCIDTVTTPSAPNLDCGFTNPALEDPTPRTMVVDYDYTWTPDVGSPFGDTVDIDLTITDAFDATGVIAPDPILGTFDTSNQGTGTWWAWHNEEGHVIVWEYDTTGVYYRGVSDVDGCYSGYMRTDLGFVGTWSEINCP